MTHASDQRKASRRRQRSIDLPVVQAETFLRDVWADTPDTFGVLAYKKPGRGGFKTASFPSNHTAQAAAEAIRLSDEGYDVYAHLALSDRPPALGKRLDSKTVTALNCVWTELDYGATGHAAATGPVGREAALEVIHGFPLMPSIVVSSGNGFHCYWLLEEPIWIENDDDELDAAALLKGFGGGWQKYVASCGYKADPVFDLPRILRVPGTKNHKDPEQLKPVATVTRNPDTLRTVEELEAVSATAGRSGTGRGRAGKDLTSTGGWLLGQYQRVRTGCAFLRHVEANAAVLPEPEWFVAAGVLARCRDGLEHFRRLSAPYPGYDQDEADQKFTRAAELEPYSCSKIRDEHFDGCTRCPFFGAAGSPADLAGPHLKRKAVRIGAPIQEASAAAWRGVYTSQETPTLFRQGGLILKTVDRAGRANVEPCTREQFAHTLVRCVEYLRKAKASDELVEVPPSEAYLKDLWACPYPPLPQLRGISGVPLLLPDGELSASRGYDEETGFLMALPPDLTIPKVSKKPRRRDVARARGLVLDELLGQFDFVGDADRAHAVAALLWPFGRALTNWPQLAPLHLISKPTQGSGGSLLARVLLLPAHGLEVGIITEAESDAEWRKKITALALTARSAVFIDNLRATLDSGALAAALTTARWSDRLLGSNRMVDLEFAPLWLATGNNPVLSSEISRRTVQIRIDPRVDRPWQRQEWRHPHLVEWATDNRGDLIWAALVLWKNWISEGRPSFSGQLLGSYENWSRTIGGVLEAAGIPGFLSNLDSLYEASDEAGNAERMLLACWYEASGDKPLTSRQVFDQFVDEPALDIPFQLKGRTDKEQTMEIGKLLGKICERRYDVEVAGRRMTLYVERAKISAGTQRWRLQRE